MAVPRNRGYTSPHMTGSIGRLLQNRLVRALTGQPSYSDSPPTLGATVPGIRASSLSAAERYEVQPDYQRFDQRLNITRQFLWKREAIELWEKAQRVRVDRVMARKRGYSLLDWGFLNAAWASQTLSKSSINVPNDGATSWQRLGAPPPRGMEKWSGDAVSNARAVKKIARLFGAGDVGIAKLDRRWIYRRWFDEGTKESHPIKFSDEPGYEHIFEPSEAEDGTQIIPAAMKYAVVFVLPMPRQAIRAAPTLTHFAGTIATYSEIGRLIVSVAEFIRGLGYNAIPSSNCTALSIPLAIDAGLGELGRNAKLIHPVWGPVCRIAKVITDLPMQPDSPIETGATTFCETCRKCAQACPAGAIPHGERSFEPVGEFNSGHARVWQVNHWRCLEFWSKTGTNCGICLVSCPFNKGGHWTHQVTKAAIARLPVLDPLIADVDAAFGYGRTDLDSFWEVDDL